MNRTSQSSNAADTGVENISPLNATYILDRSPHRRYSRPDGGLFEMKVQVARDEGVGERVGIIGVIERAHINAEFDVETYILRENGQITHFEIGQGEGDKNLFPREYFYGLLNPIDIGDFQLFGSDAFLREIGIRKQEDYITHQTRYLFLVMEQVQQALERVL